MKNFILVLLLAFSLPAFAGSTIETAGESATTAPDTLKAIQLYFKTNYPHIKGDAFVDGAMNFSRGSKQYNKMWTDRMHDDFDQPESYAAAMAAGKKLWETPFANGKTFASCFSNGGKGAALAFCDPKQRDGNRRDQSKRRGNGQSGQAEARSRKDHCA